MKKCPQCHCEMDISVKQGVEIDICVPCSVVWLDRGELNHICDSSSVVSQAMKQLLGSVTKTTMLSCPTCNDKKLSSATVVGASLSVCVDCQGILLKAATLRWFREKALTQQREYDRHTPRMPSKDNASTGSTIVDVLAGFADLLYFLIP